MFPVRAAHPNFCCVSSHFPLLLFGAALFPSTWLNTVAGFLSYYRFVLLCVVAGFRMSADFFEGESTNAVLGAGVQAGATNTARKGFNLWGGG
jgi:hypothetical protein